MRHLCTFLATAALATVAASQTCAHAPDSASNAGTCNVIPFGDNTGSTTWVNQKYQMLVPASFIGTVPTLIRELAFAPCGTGEQYFSSLVIKMDHVTGGTLSTTFAANVGANAVTVLSVKDFVWHRTADTWSPLGLQKPFTYLPPLGDLVIEVEAQGSKNVGATQPALGFHRSSTLQRVYAVGWTGTAPGSGSTDSAALKVQLCTDLAVANPFGQGCKGSNNLVPQLSYPTPPKLNSAFSIQVAQVIPATAAFLLYAASNGAPYPIDLSVINMVGCSLYVPASVAQASATNANGIATVPLPIPNNPTLVGVKIFNQFAALDPLANGTGVVMSNGGWFLVGT